ncbi:helix-turn-helix domain-containing protein [Mammaliicoccus sciuri]|uniref:helix-turn-helix transcriptional regulator n=1 Tax=Mammaliicoccus sciuri TaxID=1296 RepID=UPI0019547CE9
MDKRNELGLTQQDLANKAGVHRSYIAMTEKGTRTSSVTVAFFIFTSYNQSNFMLLYIKVYIKGECK